MKSLPPRLLAAALLFTFATGAGADPANETAANAELLKGFVVTGTLTKTIGGLACYAMIREGDTFEIDLSNLPTKEITFTHPPEKLVNPTDRPSSEAYLLAPLIVERVSQWEKKNEGTTGIELKSSDPVGDFRIMIGAEQLKPGSKVWMTFTRRDGFVGSMAEGEGILRKTSVHGLAKPSLPPGESREVQEPIGRLGYPIGTFLTIEGVREETGKVGTQTLLVSKIEEDAVEKPFGLWIENVELPAGVRCVLKGYESGAWIGVPDNVLKATGGESPQAAWQFHFPLSRDFGRAAGDPETETAVRPSSEITAGRFPPARAGARQFCGRNC